MIDFETKLAVVVVSSTTWRPAGLIFRVSDNAAISGNFTTIDLTYLTSYSTFFRLWNRQFTLFLRSYAWHFQLFGYIMWNDVSFSKLPGNTDSITLLVVSTRSLDFAVSLLLSESCTIFCHGKAAGSDMSLMHWQIGKARYWDLTILDLDLRQLCHYHLKYLTSLSLRL